MLLLHSRELIAANMRRRQQLERAQQRREVRAGGTHRRNVAGCPASLSAPAHAAHFAAYFGALLFFPLRNERGSRGGKRRRRSRRIALSYRFSFSCSAANRGRRGIIRRNADKKERKEEDEEGRNCSRGDEEGGAGGGGVGGGGNAALAQAGRRADEVAQVRLLGSASRSALSPAL